VGDVEKSQFARSYAHPEAAMDAIALISVYILTSIVMQLIGFGISRAVDYEFPTAGLMTFLTFFLGAFFIAWPVAVRIFDKLWGDRPRRGESDDQMTARRSGKKLDYQASLDRKS
jgi:hypothetical protein